MPRPRDAASIAARLTAYASIGFDSPDGYTTDGRVTRWRGSFSVWLRSQYVKGQEADTYARYKELRTALDGAEYTGGKLKLTGGAPQIAGGLAEPQLLIEART